ncbi:hypothetical protein ACSF86_02760 [Moraxella bovoculi]
MNNLAGLVVVGMAGAVARFTPAVRCWYACPCWGGSVLVVGSVGAGAYLC